MGNGTCCHKPMEIGYEPQLDHKRIIAANEECDVKA